MELVRIQTSLAGGPPYSDASPYWRTQISWIKASKSKYRPACRRRLRRRRTNT